MVVSRSLNESLGMMGTASARIPWPGALFCLGLLAGAGTAFGTLFVQIGQNFTGSTYGVNTVYRPADGDGAIGPNHFVELINGRFAVYAKTNGAVVESMTSLAFWQNAGIVIPGGQDVSDPRGVV